MPAKTMQFGESGGVLLCVHTAEPGADECEQYIEYCRGLLTPCNKTFVVTDGGGPNAAQRKALQDRYLAKKKATEREHLVAVMTDSALVRGIVKALNWFNPDANSFPYNDGAGVPLALKHLRIDDVTGQRTRVEIRVLRTDCGWSRLGSEGKSRSFARSPTPSARSSAPLAATALQTTSRSTPKLRRELQRAAADGPGSKTASGRASTGRYARAS